MELLTTVQLLNREGRYHRQADKAGHGQRQFHRVNITEEAGHCRRNVRAGAGSKTDTRRCYDRGESIVKPIRAVAWSQPSPAAEGQAEWASDWARVQECVTGDEAACTRLVTDHQRMVYQLSLHLLGDQQEALDLSQEVFLRVFRTLGQFRGQSALRTWIYRVVVTQASNRRRWWRRRHQSQQVALDQHVAQHGDLADARPFAKPDQVAEQRETAQHVWTALDRLPFDQRTILVLREIDGLSYDEIAGSLNVAVGTVKSRLARAREHLREELRASS